MSMLGATTSELADLAAQLGATSGDIGAVSGDTQTVSRTVSDEMSASFVKALSGISNAMSSLRTTVETAAGRLDATTWTGQNRETFNSAYGDFNTAMVGLEGAINDAYAQFDAQMRQVSALIEEFQSQVTVSLDQAQASTASMQQAVVAQRDNLETVMNTGLGVA